MAKTKEELEALRARCAALAEELQGLTDEELEQVAGGTITGSGMDVDMLSKAFRVMCSVQIAVGDRKVLR